MDLNELFSRLREELRRPGITKLPSGLYTKVAEYLQKEKALIPGKDIPSQLRAKEMEACRTMVERLLEVRVLKAMKLSEFDDALLNLSPEERYIVEPFFDSRKRMEKVSQLISQGRIAYLQRLAKKRASRKVLVRFLKDFPAVTGTDLIGYGPFKKEDMALIPYDNARAFVKSGIVVPVDPD